MTEDEADANFLADVVADRDAARSELATLATILTDEAVQHDTHCGGPMTLAEKAQRALDGWQDRSDAEDRAREELRRWREALRALLPELTECRSCRRPATKHTSPFHRACDEHANDGGPWVDLPWAELVRGAGLQRPMQRRREDG